MALGAVTQPSTWQPARVAPGARQQTLIFGFPDGLEHVTEIKLQKCIYIQDQCLQRLSETKNLQRSLLQLQIISCGNVTDKGVIALHKLKCVSCGALRSPAAVWGLVVTGRAGV